LRARTYLRARSDRPVLHPNPPRWCPDGIDSDPYAINDQGAVAGTAGLLDGYQHAFVWTKNKGARDLGTLVGHNAYSTARGINNSGRVVGLSYLSDEITYRAFLYTQKDGMQDLGTLGGNSSAAYGINNTGQVVGKPTFQAFQPTRFFGPHLRA